MSKPLNLVHHDDADDLVILDDVPQLPFVFKCHLCGKVKEASTEWRALYVLAFHYDRRHKGWTHETAAETSETP